MSRNAQTSTMRKFAALGAALLLVSAAVMLAPFVLTTQIARLALALVFADNSPSLGSAGLSRSGKIVLHDLVLHDSGAMARQPLIAVREADAEFNWRELLARRIRRIHADDVTVYERSNGASQLSLIGLVFELSRFGGPVPAGRGAAPLWIDTLEVRGAIHHELVMGFLLSKVDWPLALEMTMAGGRIEPSRLLHLRIGDTTHLTEKMPEQPPDASAAKPVHNTGGNFALLADLEARTAAGTTQVLLRRLAAREAALTIGADALRQFVAELPPEVRGPVQTSLGSLWAAGELDLEPPAGGQLSASLAFAGLSVRIAKNSQMMLHVDDLACSAKIDTPLPLGRRSAIKIRWFRAARGEALIQANTLRRYVPKLPSEVQGRIETSLGNLRAWGELDPMGRAQTQRLSGSLTFTGMSAKASGSPQLTLTLDDLSGAVSADTPMPPGPGATITIERLQAANTKASIQADSLRRYAARLPAGLHGPIETTFGGVQISGLINSAAQGVKRFSGDIRVQDLSMHSPAGNQYAFAMDRLAAAGRVESRVDSWSPATLTVRDGVVHWAALSYGNNALNNLDASWHVDHQTLTADRCAAQIFDGQISGTAAWDLVTGAMPRCQFQIKSINMHQALANLSPEHVDADGSAGGSLHLARSGEGELSGDMDLAFDGPGILRVGEIEELKRVLAGNFGLDMANMAMQDLKHYPFKEGRLHLERLGTDSQLKIKFVRQPKGKADVAPPRKEIINGREVWVGSLVVPVIDLTIPIRGKSLAEILAMVSGAGPLIEGSGDQHGK